MKKHVGDYYIPELWQAANHGTEYSRNVTWLLPKKTTKAKRDIAVSLLEDLHQQM